MSSASSPSDAWIAASAVATASMAIFTAVLALKTKGVADASVREAKAVEEQGKSLQEQARATTAQAQLVANQVEVAGQQLDLTRQSLRASIQPWLTVGEPEPRGSMGGRFPPLSFDEREGTLFLSLSIRNVGVGLAIMAPKRSYVVGWPSSQAAGTVTIPNQRYTPGTMDNPVLQPGEQRAIQFSIDLQRWQIDLLTLTGQHRNDGEFFIDVEYSDIAQLGATRARFHVVRNKDKNFWFVFEIAYFTPPESNEPNPSVTFR